MKIKNNVNYFNKKGSLKIWGVAMVALGFLLYYFGWGWISYILMCTFIPAGAVLFIVGSSGRASDEDIDEFIEIKMRDLDPSLDTDKSYATRIIKGTEPFTLEGYEFSEELMYQKTKSGSVRSSEFTKSILYVLTDAVYVVTRRISLVSDEEGKDTVRELAIGEIEKAEICEEIKSFTYNKNLFRVKDLKLRISMKNGDPLIIPIHDDLRSEGAAEAINRAVERHNNQE